MPDRGSHLQAARDNEALALELLDHDLGLAWAPVLGFYSALNLIDAYLATVDVHPRSHVLRRARISQESALRIARDYLDLELCSQQARYKLLTFTRPEVRAILDGPLTRIREAISFLLTDRS
jgi:hypothetical protein